MIGASLVVLLFPQTRSVQLGMEDSIAVIAEIVVVVSFLLYVLFAAVSINSCLTWHCSMLERLRFKLRKVLTRPNKCGVQSPKDLCSEKDWEGRGE